MCAKANLGKLSWVSSIVRAPRHEGLGNCQIAIKTSRRSVIHKLSVHDIRCRPMVGRIS